MTLKLTSDDFSNKQIQILKLLFEKEYRQKELQEALSTTAPNLHYHLKQLEKLALIKKTTLFEVGNVKINSITLNPPARQQVRKIITKEVKNLTLITGFGLYETGYRVPDLVFNILKKYHYPITRIICFTSQDAKEKRLKHKEEEKLMEIDQYHIYTYNNYKYYESEFFEGIEKIISEEMQNSDVIIDVTPLSKLYSFKLLEIVNKYQIPAVYLGEDKDAKEKLYWMSNMRIEGTIESFD